MSEFKLEGLHIINVTLTKSQLKMLNEALKSYHADLSIVFNHVRDSSSFEVTEEKLAILEDLQDIFKEG